MRYIQVRWRFRSLSSRALRRAVLGVWLGLFGHELLAPAQAAADPISGSMIAFDIPSQSLAQALDAYGRVTGMAVLVDQALILGRHSADVQGLLTPDQALRILVAGNGLSIQYTGDKAFTLRTAEAATSSAPDVPRERTSRHVDDEAYFADVQDSLVRALCRRPETRPGSYRLGIQLWISPKGRVSAAHLLDSSGDANRDRVVAGLLQKTAIASPPSFVPQPITIVLLPQQGTSVSNCQEGGK
jgi:hypothetical protein